MFVSPSCVEGEQAKEPGNEKCFVTRTTRPTRTHLSDVIVSNVFLQQRGYAPRLGKPLPPTGLSFVVGDQIASCA